LPDTIHHLTGKFKLIKMARGVLILVLLINSPGYVQAQNFSGPDTVTIQSGALTLKGLFWRPLGNGPFPTVIFSHGNYGPADTLYNPLLQISLLGPLFAAKGYNYLGLFRRGVGLSVGQGQNSDDLMNSAFKEKGQEARNKMQLQQLETDQFQDMISGLGYLRNRKEVDTSRMAIVGHSFGGSLALIVAEQDPGIKAVVLFGAAGYSWDRSPQLRLRLIQAAGNITAPIMIIHARNDYSTNPGYELDSVLNIHKKPHLLVIYSKFGNTNGEGHNLIFLNIPIWEADVFRFLDQILKR
jgi:dienelactone hydrolase